MHIWVVHVLHKWRRPAASRPATLFMLMHAQDAPPPSSKQKLQLHFNYGIDDLPAGPFRSSLTELEVEWSLAEAALRAGPTHALWDLPQLRVLSIDGLWGASGEGKKEFKAAAAQRLPSLRTLALRPFGESCAAAAGQRPTEPAMTYELIGNMPASQPAPPSVPLERELPAGPSCHPSAAVFLAAIVATFALSPDAQIQQQACNG